MEVSAFGERSSGGPCGGFLLADAGDVVERRSIAASAFVTWSERGVAEGLASCKRDEIIGHVGEAFRDDVDDAAFDRSLNLNLASPFALAHQAVPALRAARGSIAFITCSSASVPMRSYLPYIVSKGALRHLMKTLALELAPEVRVNAVAPGTVMPPPSYDAAAVQRLARAIPLARVGSPQDIARAVVFLSGSPFITGHELAVDGGRSVARSEHFG